MPNLLIIGDTNNGKTVIVREFERPHRGRDNPRGESARVPVLLVQAPPVPSESRFYSAILDQLFVPHSASASPAAKQQLVLQTLRYVETRMLVIDELHHLLAGHATAQRQCLNMLKYLGNELQIPIVGVGTKDAVRAMQADPQIANRFEPIGLPRWEMGREFVTLLATFERMLPIREASGLAQPKLATKILALSEGTIGELANLLNAAAIHAVRTGRERIDDKVLREIDWTPPSERKRRIETLK
jgi:hypothetical protein